MRPPSSTPGSGGLWPHQREAVDAITKALREGERATAIAACGAGKTRIGGEVAATLVPPGGRLLIIAPTLELITQTLHEHREIYGEREVGRLIAVCSDHAAIYQSQVDLAAEHAEVTTDPALLARLLAAPGRATVACTYTSLIVLRDAHARHGLATWDLAIVDEAHRSAGASGKAWGIIHDDALIPARRRLYLSATPRLLTGQDQDAVGMDDETVFGPVAFRLTFADAIERGLLADYRVVVAVATDEQVHRQLADQDPAMFLSAGGRAGVSPQVLAAQIAVLRAASEHGARRIITYHNTVKAADAFAATLHAAARLLPDGERPAALTALSVSGAQPVDKRRPILRRLGGDEPGVVVVSNARVLSEGVNIPAVDAVAFLDPRDSPESITQAVGRALRTGGATGKIATVIIPLVLAAGESPESALGSSVWEPVWRAVRALRAHDERLAERLDAARRRIGTREAGPEDGWSLPDWMHVTGIPVPASFAAAVALKVVTTATSSWEEHYGRAVTAHQRHGMLKVDTQDAAMRNWLREQRRQHRAGVLSAERFARLDALGMPWRPAQEAWLRGLEAAIDYHRAHGNLAIPASASWNDYPLGAWLVDQRPKHVAAKLSAWQVQALGALGMVWDPAQEAWERNLAVAADYCAVNGHLNVKAAETWQGHKLGSWVATQRQRYAATAGTDPQPEASRDPHTPPENPGAAPPAAALRSARSKTPAPLSPAQIAALEALGMDWDPLATAWTQYLEIARDYVRHRRALPTQSAEWGDPPFKIGAWYLRQRAKARDGQLPARQADAIIALAAAPGPQPPTEVAGPSSAGEHAGDRAHGDPHAGQDDELWLTRLDLLCAYQAEHDGALPTAAMKGTLWGDPPTDLYAFLADQRRRRRDGTLSPHLIELLGTLGPRWRSDRHG